MTPEERLKRLEKLADAILDCRERYQQQPGESEEAFLARVDAMPEEDQGLLLLGLLGPPRTPDKP